MATTQKQVRQVLLIGGSIFALSMAYGSGMRSRVREIQHNYELYKIFRLKARGGQLDVQANQAQIHQLEARRLLDIARKDLGRGDTGAAKATVAEAITRLRTAQIANAATTADFAGLITDLGNLSLADAATAARSLDGFATTMDEKFAASNVLPAPDTLSPVTIPPPTDNEKPTLGNDVTRVN